MRCTCYGNSIELDGIAQCMLQKCSFTVFEDKALTFVFYEILV